MSTQVQYRRGSNVQVAAFTGALGELVIDTTNKVVVVNDGATAGGFPQVGLDSAQTITNKVYQGTSLSASGNVTGGNVISGGIISSAGNISSTGNIILGDTRSINIGSLVITDDTIRSTEHTITIGSLGNIGNVIIGGNLTVNGNTTTFNSTTISTNDLTYNLANNASTSLQANGGGIEVGPVGSPFITFLYNNSSNAWVSSAGLAVTGNIINNQANAVGNIGSSTGYFNTIFAKATSAQYADLAEMYCADNNYSPGTLVEFGGHVEVTATTKSHSTRVAGIISTNPSYLMNSTLECENAVAVALTGRVPCLVVGTIRKGDRLVSSDLPGVAQAMNIDLYQPGCIIGKSLENYNSTEVGTIEVAVGRT